mmetsp:Transcript_28163/g.32289  ORF Transcript_28163/g.32289 Transcript_28163/m.32289 type:complete len:116 (+) Transcript_28163:83-430(+)
MRVLFLLGLFLIATQAAEEEATAECQKIITSCAVDYWTTFDQETFQGCMQKAYGHYGIFVCQPCMDTGRSLSELAEPAVIFSDVQKKCMAECFHTFYLQNCDTEGQLICSASCPQ